MAGFGRSPFGKGPFGRSSTGNDLVVQRFPESYFNDAIRLGPGETPQDNNKDPLLFLLKTYANSVFLRRLDIDAMPDLIDFEKAPLEIVRLTGDMLGISIDKNDPEFLQRALLGSASQWLQIKSTKQGYSVRGLASGFAVSVDNFWRVNPIYQSLIPARFQYFLVPPEADPTAQKILHTDKPPGTFPGTPTVEDETYAKSSYVRLVFQVVEPRIEFVDYNALLDLVILKIKDVVGIHHELQPPQLLTIFNIPVPITVTMMIEEFSIFQASECFYYDITAADDVADDFCFPTVDIIPGVGFVWNIETNFTVTIEEDETDGFSITIPIDAPITLSVQIQEENDLGIDETVTAEIVSIEEDSSYDITETVSFEIDIDEYFSFDVSAAPSLVFNAEDTNYFTVEGFDHFDTTPADVTNLDNHGYVTFTTTQAVDGAINVFPSADFSASGTGEEVQIIIDPADSTLKEIDEQVGINVPTNITVDILIPTNIDLGATFTISTSEDTELPVNANTFSVDILFPMDVFVAATVTLDIQDFSQYSIIETTSVILDIFETDSFNSSVSLSTSLENLELSGISVFETAIASMQSVDAILNIPVHASSTIEIFDQEFLAVVLVETEVVIVENDETTDIVVIESVTCLVEKVNVEMSIAVASSVSIQVTEPEVQSANISVTTSSAIVNSEVTDLIVVESATCSIEMVDVQMSITVPLSSTIEILDQEFLAVVLVETEVVLEQNSEKTDIVVIESATCSIEKIDMVMSITVASSVSIQVTNSEVESIIISEIGASTVVNSESSSFTSIEVETVLFTDSEVISAVNITESLNVSSSLRELADIGVTFNGSVSMTSTTDGWTGNISTSINATPNIYESSIGRNYGNNTALGWIVDAFPYYDNTAADTQTTDAHGFVTMTIQIGP